MVNPEKRTYYNKGSEFFGIDNYDNIPLPYLPDTKFGDLTDKFFLEYENKDDSDDDMDYPYSMSNTESKKKEIKTKPDNTTNDGYYEEAEHGMSRRKVFELEIFWNKKREQAAIHKLDR